MPAWPATAAAKSPPCCYSTVPGQPRVPSKGADTPPGLDGPMLLHGPPELRPSNHWQIGSWLLVGSSKRQSYVATMQ